MRKYITIATILVFWSCNSKIMKPKPRSSGEISISETHVDKQCAELDSVLFHRWKLAAAPQAAYFRLYERNDTLVKNYITGKFSDCFHGKSTTEVTNKLGEPTYKSLYLIYYEFLSSSEPPYCLKMWVHSDTISQIRYEPCTTK